VVQAQYTNGQSVTLGQVALANFADPNGLAQQGNSAWAQTAASGQALYGQAGTAGLGQVESGSLEESNVDVTTQLVEMITAQRAFQANAQMISTENQITQTVIQIPTQS
jgi:flagellar hook protein FlgE